MDTRRGRAATCSGAVIVCLGSVAWAFAATSMTAVHAAEARALGPGHTAEMPGEDELALVAHDSRLAAMIVVSCGLALAVAALPRRRASTAWLGGVVVVVVANATLGRAVDGGSVVLAAGGLVLLTGTAGAGALWLHARRDSTRDVHSDADDDAGSDAGAGWQRFVVAAGAVAAGTLPVLVAQGMGSERYVDWVPADLVTASLVTALGLAVSTVAAAVLLARSAVGVLLGVVMPSAAVVLLVEPAGSAWQVRDEGWVMGVVLVLASAPLVLAAAAGRSGARRWYGTASAVMLAVAGALALVPQLLVVPIVFGEMLGMVLTAPAGAYVNYDGLPLTGGGVLLAAALWVVLSGMRGGAGPSAAAPEVPSRGRRPSR